MIRGLWTHAGVLYSVEDATLFSIDSAGLKTSRNTINSTSGVVDFASNLTQLVINDGSYLYTYTPTTDALATTAGYPGGDRISFLDQRIIFQYRGTQLFGWTGLGSASVIGAADVFSAQSSPDLLVSQLVSNRELWLFGTDGTEIWDSIGGLQIFARSSAAIDYGCVAPHSAQKTGSTVYWLGRDTNGQAIVVGARGHQAARVSDRGLEEQLAKLTDLSGARAFCYSDGGLSFYVLNVPGLNTTWVYEETFRQWHERCEWVNGDYAQWSPTCHAFAYGKHYFGCGSVLATSDQTVNNYLGNPKRRQRIAPVISAPDRRRVTFSSFEVICDKGTNGTLMLRWSDDNGANLSNWHYTTPGNIGQFANRAKFTRLGSSYDRVFDLVMSDDAPFNPVAVNIPL